jgi:hypothetical protein
MNEKAGADKLFLEMMLPEHMTYILAQKTFNAFTKLLNPVYVFLRHTPGTISGIRGPGFELFDLLLHPKVPGYVRYQIPDQGEGFHRLQQHGFIRWQIAKPGHAHKLWHSVYFSGAGAATPCLAVPSHSQIRRLFSLDLQHGIQHHHAFGDFSGIVFHSSTTGIPPYYLKGC